MNEGQARAVVKLLLDKGADPNAPYKKTVPPRQAQGNINVAPGATPLQRAVRAVDRVAVRLLLDKRRQSVAGARGRVDAADGRGGTRRPSRRR